MLEFTPLPEVCEALPGSMSDRPFVTGGEAIEVHRERGNCYFTLAEGNAQLQRAALRHAAAGLGFWAKIGQVLEVEGYADARNGRLDVIEARLVSGRPLRLGGHNARSARRLLDAVAGFFK